MADIALNPAPSALPIAEVLPALECALQSCSRVVIEAPPGAGKSTYLPLWLAQRDANAQQRIILIQPRRLAASNVARYLALQTGTPLGNRVGLRTRYDHKISADTVIEVVTEGIFLRQIQRDPELTGVRYVLFDEYHERSWQADVALAFALETQSQWRSAEQPLQLLVMSATLPAVAVAKWFDAPLVTAQGRCFPVEIQYCAAGRLDLNEHLAQQIEAALAAGSQKILVFLAGWQVMQRLQRRLQGRFAGAVHLLHSSLPPEQQQQALARTTDGLPSVVLATNIAETSLTIDGVDTVIDSGQVRRPRFDPSRGMDRLETGWISRASADQRAGRAGRLGPGRCIRLWSAEQQGRLPEHDAAEIHSVDLTPLALELALWSSDRSVADLLPEQPLPQRLQEARQLLMELGALDANERINADGRAMSELGVHPRLGSLVRFGRQCGKLNEACLLAALLSEGDFLRRDGDNLPVDLEWRMQLLDGRQAGQPVQIGVLQRIKQLAKQLIQRGGTKTSQNNRPQNGSDSEKNVFEETPLEVGALLIAAFPDRIARRRQAHSNRYLGIDGFEFVLDQNDALRAAEWLVIADHDGSRQGARIRLAAAVSEDDVLARLARRLQVSEALRWDEATQRLGAKRTRSLGAITLDEQILPIDDERATAIWLEEIRQRGLAWLRWPETVTAWLERARWIQRRVAAWPDFSAAHLLATLDRWLAPYLAGIRRLEQLRALDFSTILRAQLDYEQQQQLAQVAPERLQLPSGATHSIEYRSDGPPKLAARLTEFYGLNEHPSVGGEALLLELLSPAHRPVQLTQDLPGFWRTSYVEVRKEMKGRYPKHFWPEQPGSAPATTTVKKRMKVIPD